MSLAQDIVNLLNSVHKLDSHVLTTLIDQRVQPNQQLLNSDLHIVVLEDDLGRKQLGLLGILNGLIAHEHQLVVAVYSDDLQPALLHFELREKDNKPMEWYHDVRSCPNCNMDTAQSIRDSTHERDSSADLRICHQCGATYSGYTGKFGAPNKRESAEVMGVCPICGVLNCVPGSCYNDH